jgi:hypothetical protein
MERLPFAVVRRHGDEPPVVVARRKRRIGAEAFIAAQRVVDRAGVERGDYSIDGPEEGAVRPQGRRRGQDGTAITVAELIGRLAGFDPELPVWVVDTASVEGYVPILGAYLGFDEAPGAGEPAEFVALDSEQ